MGHAYLAAGQLSELSERRVLGGNQHALPADLFATADYTALGHLHLAQSPAEGVHYSGSPLPLSLAEANYNHQVLEVTFAEGKLAGLERIPVPRAVEMIRLPQSTLDDALNAIASLELPACPQEAQPFLEVRLLLPKPEARIRERLRDTAERLGNREGLEDAFTAGDLMMVSVLRIIEHDPLLNEHATLVDYVRRGTARPAFKRALASQLDGSVPDGSTHLPPM